MEVWTTAEIAAVQSRDKRRIWLFEIELVSGTWRAAQSIRTITDGDSRSWTGWGANGDVQGMGTGFGRRPRNVSVTLHGLAKGQSIYARVTAEAVIGAPVKIYMAWVDSAELVIVEPKLRFAGLVAANPVVELNTTDRVTLQLLPGKARANRRSPSWDRSPQSHRTFAGSADTVYDRVTEHTQFPVPI